MECNEVLAGSGVDGFRLDAVPYLTEREGTNCENLPETHAILKDFRRRLDEQFPGRMLLAEANQWPADLRPYFADGDEFHMAFHFPLMPRMFMGVKLEDRKPITEILQQTPEIPASCQWCLFLRNHDELTLEMVTDIERDYMYDVYAKNKTMRLNLGIRRRLAPLLDNDRTMYRVDEWNVDVPAGHSHHLLRGRNRNGRQRQPRRSRWSKNSDAMERRLERGLFQR